MKFNIIGAPVNNQSRLVERVLAVVEALPDGDLLTSDKLAALVGYSPDYIRARGGRFPEHIRVKHKVNLLYGNPKTIKAFRATQLHH